MNKETFYEFLTNNCCYNCFVINWRSSYKGDCSRMNEWVEEYLKEASEDMISLAFPWKESPEGFNFWKQKDTAWREFCKIVNKIDYPVYRFTQTKKILWQVTAEKELAPRDIDHIKDTMVKMYPETENYDTSAKSILGWKYVKNISKEPSV